MDPLTATTTFATIVQLLGMFKQERKAVQETNDAEFMSWLTEHKFEAIKATICSTAAIQTEVTNLLRQDSALIQAKLDVINGTLASLLSRIDGFQGLSRSLIPDAELSDQAISTLKQFVGSNSKKLFYQELANGAVFQPEDGEPFFYSELRFLSDDLDSLERCGLITLRSLGNHGSKVYGLTRAGVRYVEIIGKTDSNEPA